MVRCLAWVLLSLAFAGSGLAAEDCASASAVAYEEAPRYFRGDHPDSLYGLVLMWDTVCGPAEVIDRTRILGAIWDDAFDESIYGDDVLDGLITHGEVLRSGPDQESDDPRERYDAFTQNLADQMLPHQEANSLELFFCLFYSGRIDEAWTLLQSPDLPSTYLGDAYYYEIESLTVSLPEVVIAVTGGWWSVRGDAAFVGDKPLPGVLVGMRGQEWLGRMVVDVRAGRADEPYWASTDLRAGRSDRYNATHVGLEVGRVYHPGDRVDLDLFGGVGANFHKPFAEDDHVMVSAQASVGLGLRFVVGANRNILVGVDTKYDWWTDPSAAGATPMGGEAWVVRLAVGLKLDQGRNSRLRALGQ